MASTAPSSPPALDDLSANVRSETSVGFAEPCPSNIVVSANMPVIPPSEKSVPLLDACCLALYCQAHEKLLLSPLKGGVGVGSIKGLFLPTVSTMRSDYNSWHSIAGRLLYSTLLAAKRKSAVATGSAGGESGGAVGITTTALHCIDWYRVQQPKRAPAYNTRVTFTCSIPSGQKCYCFSSKATAVGATSSAVAAAPQIPPPSSAITGATNTNTSMGNSYSKRDFWLTVEELKQTNYQDNLWGPEVVAIAEEVRAHYGKQTKASAEADAEWTGPRWMHEMNVEDALALLANRNGEYSKERALLFSARYSEEEVLKLFNEFVVQCFPSQFMTFASFRAFMAKLSWHEEDSLLKVIFSTLVSSAGERVALQREKDSISNSSNNIKTDKSPPLYLTFSELLLGLSTMEEKADHRGDCLFIRLKYIFHFYDEDHDGRLNRKELEKFVGDIGAKGRSGPGTASAVASSNIESSRSNEGVRAMMMSAVKANGGVGGGPGSSINGNNNNAGGASANLVNELVEELFHKLTNTTNNSTPQPPLTDDSAISEQQFTEPVSGAAVERLAELTESLFRSNQSTVESATGRFAYRRVGHNIGKLGVGARQVTALTRYDEPCERCRRTARFDLCTHGIRVDEWGAIRGTIKFNLCSDYRDVTFRQEVAIDEATFNWIMQFNRYVSMINSASGGNGGAANPLPRPDRYGIKSIVELVLAIVRNEPPVVQLSSPCYIIGEVRSSLETLYRLQSTIARWYPFVNPANLVLLGNAVDGADPQAADTAVYLLCLKALSPYRITLFRGPLEMAAVTDKNSLLHRDWVALYGEATWKGLQAIVEQLPVAAVLDNRLFLTKSGLPQPVMSIEAIEQTLKVGTSASDSKKHSNSAAKLLLNSLQNGVHVCKSTKSSRSRSRSAKSSKRKSKSARSKSSQASGGSSGSGGGSRPKTSVATKKRTPGQVSTGGGKVSKAKLHKVGARKSAAPPAKRSPRSKASSAAAATAASSVRNNSAGKGGGRSPASSTPSPSPSSEAPSLSARNQLVFSTAALEHFLRLNGLSHCIRTEMLPPIGARGPFRVAAGERLITIGGIGKQQSAGCKLWGSILLATRQKVRLISLKSLFAGRHSA